MTNQLGTNRAFYLLSVTSLGVFILLFSLIVKVTPLTIDHTVYFCQQAVNNIRFSLPHAFPSLLVLILVVIFSVGVLLFSFQFFKTRFFVSKLLRYKVDYPKSLKKSALQLGILDKIDVVRTNQHLSFCYGLLKPRICLSLNVIKNLNNEELKAILVHESYHLKSRDPLKILLGQVVVSMFFFVPILRDLQKYYSLSKEINADKLVVKMEGIQNLKSALAKALTSLTPSFSGVTPFATADNLEIRLNILINPDTKIKRLVSPYRVVLSTLIILLTLLFLNLPVHAMEDSDGSHSYYFMSPDDLQMASCITESTLEEHPFSEQDLYSPVNYSVKH